LQPSWAPLVIAGVLGIICLGGLAAWLANTKPEPVTTERRRRSPSPVKDDRQSVAVRKPSSDQLQGRPWRLAKDDYELHVSSKLAADQGNPARKSNLGFFYENGRGGLARTTARLHGSVPNSPRTGDRRRSVFYGNVVALGE